ncbi:MAG: hypothetical protein DRN24_07075 [Thermoplasmata archaeon]|nr:MAG: hypothetical protein DRN24_07075 [Thermoplasmata archaeon]
MKTIKFSHWYRKLNKINVSNPVTLIDVLETSVSEWSDSFLEYDTVYFEDGVKKNYPLKDYNRYLLLFFMDCDGCLFTTIRRSTPKKQKYYLNSIGDSFKVEIRGVDMR